jgi:aspartate aminotransferase
VPNAPVDVAPFSARKASATERGLSQLARELVGSRILEIAAEIRELKAKGAKVCDLTVGDFSSKEFPIPEALLSGVLEALKGGHTNYPPSDGVPELRSAVKAFYEERLGLSYPLDGILIASGARPVLCGAFAVLVDQGDTVIYPAPSWNNDAYSTMFKAKAVAVPTRRENRFMPTVDDVKPYLDQAKLLVVNSPLNPAGTLIRREDLLALCQAIVAENQKRAQVGRTPLYLIYDLIYWMLAFRGAEVVTPVGLVPEMAAYTIFVDGISKAFAATGLRVGWCVGPTDVVTKMKAYLGHVGAWAPRPEQVATAKLLRDGKAVDAFEAVMHRELEARMTILYEGLGSLAKEGFDLEVIPPQGAIYLSMRVNLFGIKRPDTGAVLKTNTDVRKYLLDAAGFAVVPFQAFGLEEETGWFRLSVGAVSRQDCQEIIPRLRQALQALGAAKKAANG